MAGKKHSITAIAKQAGVSVSTVSRVLNNHPYVTKEVHDKVLASIHRLDYQPRSAPDKKRLAIVINNTHAALNSYSSSMLFHLTRQCDLNNISTEIIGGSNLELLEENFLKVAIFFQDFLMEDDLKRFPYTQFIGINNPMPGCGSVCSDDRQGIALAMEHLYKCGHRRIALILPNSSANHCLQTRRSAFCEYSVRIGIHDPDSMIAYFDQKPVEAAARLIRAQKPDALLIAGEDMLFPANYAAAMLGLNVPDDLSIVSYENCHASEYMVPPHTTIVQNFSALAENTVRLALEILEGKASAKDVHIEIANDFMERDSVKKRKI